MTEGRGLRNIPANVFENIFGCKYPKSQSLYVFYSTGLCYCIFFGFWGKLCKEFSLLFYMASISYQAFSIYNSK